MAAAVPEHGGGGWSSKARAGTRLRSSAPLRSPGTLLCSSSDTGGEASLLFRSRFMYSVRMRRSRVGPDLCASSPAAWLSGLRWCARRRVSCAPW